MKKRPATGLEQYASKGVLVFSGSLLVVSVALNNVGFKEVIDAWSASIVAGIESKPNKVLELRLNQLEHRLEEVEKLAHTSGDRNE